MQHFGQQEEAALVPCTPKPGAAGSPQHPGVAGLGMEGHTGHPVPAGFKKYVAK